MAAIIADSKEYDKDVKFALQYLLNCTVNKCDEEVMKLVGETIAYIVDYYTSSESGVFVETPVIKEKDTPVKVGSWEPVPVRVDPPKEPYITKEWLSLHCPQKPKK